MNGDLDYVFSIEQVRDLHVRALGIFDKLVNEGFVDEAIKPNVYNSVLNMCANVKQSPLAQGILPRMDIPRG